MAEIRRMVDIQYEISHIKQMLTQLKDKSMETADYITDNYKHMGKTEFRHKLKKYSQAEREIGRLEKKKDYLNYTLLQMEEEHYGSQDS